MKGKIIKIGKVKHHTSTFLTYAQAKKYDAGLTIEQYNEKFDIQSNETDQSNESETEQLDETVEPNDIETIE